LYEYAPGGQTINKEFYLVVLRGLRETVCQKWRDGDKDNAPGKHFTFLQKFLAQL
jgi:hypothetical protein